MAAQIAAAFIFLAPLWLIEYSHGATTYLSTKGALALLYLGIFPSVLGYILFTLAVSHFGAAQASLCIHLIPLFGAVLAVVFLGESLHLYHAAGMAVILVGIRLALKSREASSSMLKN